MPTVRVYEDLGTFVRKHVPAGLVACGRHSRQIATCSDIDVVQLELPGGLSFGPICMRHCVAAAIFNEIVVYDASWLPQAEKLGAEYNKYKSGSDRPVKVVLYEIVYR